MGVQQVIRADNGGIRWCILRTSPGRTLAVAASLAAAGFDAWTPRQTLKRTKLHARTRLDGTKQTIEVDVPIMPTIVFARQRHLAELAMIASAPISRHPPFSLFRHYDLTPLVADSDLEGMLQEERDAAELVQKLRDIEDRQEQRRIRAEAARNARERRKALRAEQQNLVVGAEVSLRDVPAFAGMVGIVESSEGRTGSVSFGGRLPIKVEAWQVIPHAVHSENIAA